MEQVRNDRLVLAGLCAASFVGFVMSLQSASLLSGTGIIWTGAAIATAVFIFARVARVEKKAVIALGIVAALSLGSAVYMEKQLDDMRQQLQQSLNSISS